MAIRYHDFMFGALNCAHRLAWLRIAALAVLALSTSALLAQAAATAVPALPRPAGSIASRADWPKAKPEM